MREERRLRVFENKVLRRIFGPKRDEVTGEWRKLHNEELNDLYCSRNIVRVIKSRRMRWARPIARMRRGDLHTGFWWGNLRATDYLEDPDVDGRIILKEVFQMKVMNWIDLAQNRNRLQALVNAAMNLVISVFCATLYALLFRTDLLKRVWCCTGQTMHSVLFSENMYAFGCGC